MSQSTDVKNYLIGGLLIIILLLSWCNTNKKTEVKPIVKIKKEIIKQIEYKEGRVKVLKQVDIKYKTIYKTKYDTIYAQAPDTCKEYLEEFKLMADSTLKIKDMVIIAQDSVICDLKTVNTLDSAMIESYKHDMKRERRIKIAHKSIISVLFLLTIVTSVL